MVVLFKTLSNTRVCCLKMKWEGRDFSSTLIMTLASQMGFGYNNRSIKWCKWLLKGNTGHFLLVFFFLIGTSFILADFNNNKRVCSLLGSDPGKTNINPLFFTSGNIRIMEFLPFSAGLQPQSRQHCQKMRSHKTRGRPVFTTNWTIGKLHLFVKMKGISFTH